MLAHQAWVCRLRLQTLLSWAIPQGARSVREQVASGVQLVGLFTGLAEVVVAACAQLTTSGPRSRPRGP